MSNQIAKTILSQLGPSFVMMTGSKNFTDIGQSENRLGGLAFKLGRTAGVKTTHVRISLSFDDTYRMEFLRIRGTKIETLKDVSGVYFDQLRGIFTAYTGLYTSMNG